MRLTRRDGHTRSRPPQGEAPGEVTGASGVLPPRTLDPAWPEVSARRWLERLGGGDTGNSTAKPSRVSGGRCGPELRSAPDRTSGFVRELRNAPDLPELPLSVRRPQ